MDAPRTHVMGVLNITDDSFSDGGQWLPTDLTRPDIAVTHARDMICDGATIIDIGGESTRPGAVRVTEQTELQRVIPVVEALANDNVMLSVDTMRATVARQAVQAGATLINDVSGGTGRPGHDPRCCRNRRVPVPHALGNRPLRRR